ncbi:MULTISPECIES: 50S ribosomal protein L25/general stress protein Ctc [Corynebacterium]|uniref:50S ribosomal protein L25/general stress protein Ctc n=1 Tax=Corynebacterium TaxID=1716 RepID=UPI00254CC9E1|nr:MULTISPECIES: 50S ribosomal protein L25/general stress protein Ctc [Corynebacterium]MDK6258850.1 50S ribosomal protein L25/general stress protein Ctc [Corynebacterium frankenforstense]MDK8895028.1 50S ribosomal protein L25/general stress protein Ctc [Corynebacterium sp. MSK006]
MADYKTLQAEPRTEFGKGAARRLRREWRVPGVIYSGDTETIHFSLPLLEIQSLVRNHGVNAIVEIELEGEKHLTMVKHVDQNVLTFDIDHVDLLAIKRGEKVEVEVPIVVEGEPQAGTIAVQDAYELLVEADVLNIPEEIIVSVEGLEIDTKITAGDLQMPGNTTLVADPETLIASISWPEPEEDEDAEDEAAEEIDETDASDVEATEEDAD